MTPPDWPERPYGGFKAVLMDPAWRYQNWSAKGERKNPLRHYPCMTPEAIKALPVAELMARDSVCFMWATFPMLLTAIEVMQHYGFEYKTGGAWAKRSSADRTWAFGTGYIVRSASELLLIGTRGKPTWMSKSVRNLWVAPIREHSRKPDQVIEDIEKLTPGPYLELNSRCNRPGWTAWGDEVGKFDDA